MSIFGFGYVFAQNGTTTAPPTSSGIEQVFATIAVIGTLLGAIGTFISSLGIKRLGGVAEYAQTFGNKIVDIAHDNKRVVYAVDALAGGKVEQAASSIKNELKIAEERATAATEQLKYLNENKSLPNNPNEDASMPREAATKDNNEGRSNTGTRNAIGS